MCSMSRDPRREECTICTARAPEAVFAVRTYADTDPLYEASVSAQILPARSANPQLSKPHIQIDLQRDKSQAEAAQLLEAVKWIGNDGSHEDTLDASDVLKGIQLLVHA